MKVLDYNQATPLQKTRADFALLVLRVPFGLFLLLAGWAKIKMGVGAFATAAAATIPSYMPHSLGNAYLHAVPFAEIIVGACLIIGLLGRFAALIATLMLISFTIAVTGLKDDPKPFNANVIYIAIALALALIGPGRMSLDALFPHRGSK
jgi:putative oxidoreductase